MDINEIMNILPQRYPMLLVDKVEVLTDNYIEGWKYVTYNEPYFQGHFPAPKKPVMPAVFVIEAVSQLMAIMVLFNCQESNCNVYIAKISKAQFYAPIMPGSAVKLTCEKKGELDELIMGKVKVFVDEKMIFSAEITQMLVRDDVNPIIETENNYIKGDVKS